MEDQNGIKDHTEIAGTEQIDIVGAKRVVAALS
jgi:hypothetical protein